MGSKKSGNPYMYWITPTRELGQFINHLSSKTGRGSSTWTMWLILTHYEKETRAYFKDVLKIPNSDKFYDDLVKVHSLTVNEQRRKNEKDIEKEEEKNRKSFEMRKLRLEEKKFALGVNKENRLNEEFKFRKNPEAIEEDQFKLKKEEEYPFLHWLKSKDNLSFETSYKGKTREEKNELIALFRREINAK